MNIWVLLFAVIALAFVEWYWYRFPPSAKAFYLKHRLIIQLLPVIIYAIVRIVLYSTFEHFEALKYHFAVNAVVLIYYFIRFFWVIIDILRHLFWKRKQWIRQYWLVVLPILALIVSWVAVTEINFKVKVRNIEIKSEKVNGEIKLIHFSDLHLGSFFRTRKMEILVRLINSEEPDLLCFSGDLVNSDIREAYPYSKILKLLAPNSCKVAVLGNHDYGDAYGERDPDKFRPISNEVDHFLQACGFIVLRDSSFLYTKGTDSLVIAGTNNCGSPPFQSFGDYRKALSYTFAYRKLYTVMLTHDPDYWGQTKAFDGHSDLTLSGHTHGGQFGFRAGATDRVYLSPGSFRNDFNGGMYAKGSSFMFVSTGFGNIGLNMRLGIRPEMGVIKISGRH